MIQVLLYNELISLSMFTSILEATDWDESVASKIVDIINDSKGHSDIMSAKEALRNRLLIEKISENIIDKIFILIEAEESNMKGKHIL